MAPLSQIAQATPTDTTQPASAAIPDAPGVVPYPDAEPVPSNDHSDDATLYALNTQRCSETLCVLDGNAVVTYRGYVLHADHIEYNRLTGDVALTGHIAVTDPDNDMHLEASHGTLNIHTRNGRFYDVSGSIGLKTRSLLPSLTPRRAVYGNSNPFLFTGSMLVKTGPRAYQIYSATITSCQLPRPDWVLSASEFSIEGDRARATNSVFRLLNLPLLWLPVVTHPVDANNRQTGILIPEIGFNSAAKGSTIGEQLYWAVNRSTDITVGTVYYSARGWEQTASLRYRGLGQDFARARYSGLQDRGYYPGGGTTYVNQSGTDVIFSGRHDLYPSDPKIGPPSPHQARVVADVEYLSSFPYREAFSQNFNQAVSSDVLSTVYLTNEWNGLSASIEGDRYQGEKRVPNAKATPPQGEQQVHIFHAPALEFLTTDHNLGSSGFEWNLNTSLAALKRSQPNFQTSGMIERLDIRPEIAYPLHGGGWSLRPALAGRETFYSRSRLAAVPGVAGPPIESTAALNRADLDLQLDVRGPVLERTFDSGFVRKLLRRDVKHTIEPEFTYRYVTGIDNFAHVLRFDTNDVISNTNEIEYGATQRLFLRRAAGTPCRQPGTAADAIEVLGAAGVAEDAIEDPGESLTRTDPAEPICGNREWISWRVAQKYFFDSTFGGAVSLNGPRSILQTTLNFTGISFLTGPRSNSPVISRLRVRTSDKIDLEWDFDLDTCAASSLTTPTAFARPCHTRFTADNIYLDVHQGNVFGGIGYARLNAPARSYVDGVLSSLADFQQMRILFGFGNPTRRGLSAAANAGIDLDLGTVQYGAVQASYNWNCCGVSVEYRKYELGTSRNDNGYRFNFTLANIGSAGNLRHAEQLF